ncbi:MAG TPA: hypothetical protein VFU27_09450 [Terriglobales bacterium]|nr:hypothetical protein [Terriglobales bacterium]
MSAQTQFTRQPRVARLGVAMLAACLACSSALAQAPQFQPQQLQQQTLAALLERARERTSRLLEQFSDVRCTELVTQEQLNQKGKVEARQESTFDYLAILTSAGGNLNLSESRLPVKQARKVDKSVSLLVSNGFAILFLVFDPYYQGSFQFSAAGGDAIAGRQFARLDFRHIPGTRSPMAMVLRGREYPLDISGTAWIDPSSGVIAKITAGLDGGLPDLGLQQLHSEVEFAPLSFRDVAETSWFPVVATIDVETPKQHWRNIHRFTNYQRFSVSTEEAVSKK